MANILDEQERKRKELAAQGIHTRGVAGAQGGSAEIGYVPPSRRNVPINQIPPQNASPQADYARSAEGGAMIPPDKVGQARMLGSMPNQGSLTPFEQPADTWIQRSRDFTQSRVGGTNQQLEAARAGMGANRARSNARLTDMAEQVDPRIREDANLRREWRMMTPQQRKEHIGLKKLEMDARGAEDAAAGATWEDIDKMSRSFADATGTAMDSYGNSFYTPEQQMFIREKRRNIDRAASEMFSQADRSAWRTPQDMYQAIASLPEVQQAGPFGQAYAFNIMRRYATPQLRAQMEAEDRNQGLFTEWFNSKTEAEIAEMQQASGMRMTADGSKDYAAELFLNRDKDIGAGSIYQQFLSESPQVFTAINGRVQVDPAQEGRVEQAQAQRKAESDADAKEKELRALEEYEDKRYAAIQQMNPERAAMMIKNPITRKYEDLKEFKGGTNWQEIDAHRERIYALDALLETAKYTTDEEAWAWAQSQYPVPELGPGDDPNSPEVAKRIQEAQAAQAQAFKTWQMMIKNPENRRMLEAERYNRQLAMQGLQSSWQSPPAPQPAETGIGAEGAGAELALGALFPSVSVPAQTAAPAQQPIQAPITAAPQAPVPVAQEQKPKNIVEFKGQAERTFAPSLGKDSQAVIDTRYSDSVPVHYWNRKNGMQAEHGLAVVPVEQLSEFIARQDGANLPMVSPSKPKTAEEWARIVAEVESETGKEVKGRIIVGGELIAGGDSVYSEWKSMVRKRWKQELKKAKRA